MKLRLAAMLTLALLAIEQAARAEPAPAEPAPGLLDGVRQTVAHTLDSSARWVDGLFGPQRFGNEAPGANGRLGTRVIWREYRGFNLDTQLRANLPLDNLHRRFNAFVGKGPIEEIVQDKIQTYSPRQGEGETGWMAGLGYVPPWGGDGAFTLNAGVVVTWPLDPYVRTTYRYVHKFSDSVLLNFSPAVYWKESEQFGATSSVDIDWKLDNDRVVRFPNWLRVSGSTDGLEYDSRVQFLQNLRGGQAILYSLQVQGDTGATVPLRQYGAYAIFRKRMFREWFTAEVMGGAGMQRNNDWTERKFAVGVGLGFEIAFEEKRPPTTPIARTAFSRLGR